MTAYGWSKIKVEEEVTRLADANFSPTYLRNSTAYGLSPRLRGDLVVNNLTGVAFLTGEALLKSDGSSWRPLVHIEDISRAFLAILEAPRDVVHDQAFNIGPTSENYLIRDVAQIVSEVVPGYQGELQRQRQRRRAQLQGQLRQDRSRAAFLPASLDGAPGRRRDLQRLPALRPQRAGFLRSVLPAPQARERPDGTG